MGAGKFYASNLLAGKRAIVTGGGTGIGRAITIALIECGATVAIASRKQENLDSGAEEIREATGQTPFTKICDIRKIDAVSEFIEAASEHLGGIDILVNNAGGQFPQRAENYSVKGWNTVIDNNLNGTWYVTQTVGKKMIAASQGVIVNVIANYHRGMPGIAHTSAARAAVDNLSRSLAIEWAEHNIRINSIAPGPIDTYGFAKTYYQGIGEGLDSFPISRFGTADEVAAGVLFLAGPTSAWMTGATIDLSGGQHIWGDMWAIDRNQK